MHYSKNSSHIRHKTSTNHSNCSVTYSGQEETAGPGLQYACGDFWHNSKAASYINALKMKPPSLHMSRKAKADLSRLEHSH